MEEEDLKALAKQLSCPDGDLGRQVAEMMNESNIRMTLESIYTMNVSPGDHILEIGHGNALHLENLLNISENVHYTGLEISETMHEEAKIINQEYLEKGIAEFTFYNGIKIPFEEKSFDKIFTVNTLYFWENPVDFLKEIYRVLKDKGSFILTYLEENTLKKVPFTRYGFNIYSQSEIEHFLAESGFAKALKRTKTDEVKSKTGEQIEREFVVLNITK